MRHWQPDEDARLILLVGAHGNAWTSIAERLAIGCTPRQCRNRVQQLRALGRCWTPLNSVPLVAKESTASGLPKTPRDNAARVGRMQLCIIRSAISSFVVPPLRGACAPYKQGTVASPVSNKVTARARFMKDVVQPETAKPMPTRRIPRVKTTAAPTAAAVRPEPSPRQLRLTRARGKPSPSGTTGGGTRASHIARTTADDRDNEDNDDAAARCPSPTSDASASSSSRSSRSFTPAEGSDACARWDSPPRAMSSGEVLDTSRLRRRQSPGQSRSLGSQVGV